MVKIKKTSQLMNKITHIIGAIIILGVLVHVYMYNFPIIPKIINKVIMQDDGQTPEITNPFLKKAHKSWIINNPGYRLRYWNMNDARKYLKDNFSQEHLAAFDCIQAYAGKTNLFRLCVVYHEGGWYSDWKQECLVPSLLKKLSQYRSFVAFRDIGNKHVVENKCVQNAFFGATPKNKIIGEAIRNVLYNVKHKVYGDSSLDTTGVCVFGKAVNKFKDNLDGFYDHDDSIGPIYSGGLFVHNKYGTIIRHKCDTCGKGQDWNSGNNYGKLWKSRKYYCNDI